MGISKSFYVGQTSSLTQTVRSDDLVRFAETSGDSNPVHLDEAYAATTRFGKRIAHGMLVASYVSALLGTHFPGPGTIYLSQSLKFVRPVFIGDTLEIVATVTKFREDKAILTMETAVSNQHGETVLTGEAVCLVSDVISGHPRMPASGAAAS